MSNAAFELESLSIADTVALGRAIGELAVAGDVIALNGQLGVGKTQLVRGLAEGMGLNPRDVSSPTFVFVQEYTPSEVELPEAEGDEAVAVAVLVHLDAYRLGSADHLESIGWSDELLDGAVLAVEWAARIARALGPDVLDVGIEHAGDGRRVIEVAAKGSWLPRLAAVRAKVGS